MTCSPVRIHFSPVDCIHWTSAAQLSLLEDEMRRVERVNVRTHRGIYVPFYAESFLISSS